MHHTCSQKASHAWSCKSHHIPQTRHGSLTWWQGLCYLARGVQSSSMPSSIYFLLLLLNTDPLSKLSKFWYDPPDFLSRCHCFLGPWGKRILAALVLGCINLVFYYQYVQAMCSWATDFSRTFFFFTTGIYNLFTALTASHTFWYLCFHSHSSHLLSSFVYNFSSDPLVI